MPHILGEPGGRGGPPHRSIFSGGGGSGDKTGGIGSRTPW